MPRKGPLASISADIFAVVMIMMTMIATKQSIAFRLGGSFGRKRVLLSNHYLLFTTATSSTDPCIDNNTMDPVSVSNKVFEKDQRPVILFDGVCNMCNSAVNLALDWDPQGKLRFAALQSDVGKALLQSNGRNADDISSIVLVTRDGAFIKSDAVLKITEELTPLSMLPLKPAAVLGRYVIPKFLRDVIYDNVADNRYQIMGKRNECRLDSDGAFEDRFVDDRIAARAQL